MPIHCGIDGAVKELKGLYCGIDGAVKEIVELYCGTDSGIKKIYDGRKPLVLYDTGNEYTELTGGWQQSKLPSQYAQSYNGVSFQRLSNRMYYYADASYPNTRYLGSCNVTPIDVTRYKKMCVLFDTITAGSSASYGRYATISVYTGVEARVATNSLELLSAKTYTNHTMELDISNISGNVYLHAGGSIAGLTNAGITLAVSIKKVWLEP